jgi:hypothetical protein
MQEPAGMEALRSTQVLACPRVCLFGSSEVTSGCRHSRRAPCCRAGDLPPPAAGSGAAGCPSVLLPSSVSSSGATAGRGTF